MANTIFYDEVQKERSQIRWRDIFSESLKHHTRTEMEYALSAGTGLNTATEATMLQSWQKPWLWVRVLAGGLAVCALFYLACLIPERLSANHAAYPALQLLNYFTPPFVAALTVMTLLWELNIPRNISIYAMLGYFLLGGAFSMTFTQLLSIAGMPSGIAPLAPLTEEPGKCIAVWIFLVLESRRGRKLYGLTGLLIGAGVGGGFTVFESIQYAFIYSVSVKDALLLAFHRSIPLFGGHILFCAPYAAGLALGRCQTGSWRRALRSRLFWAPFLLSCLGHFLWNLNWIYPFRWVIAAGLWLALLRMTRRCLAQAVREGRRAEAQIPAGGTLPVRQAAGQPAGVLLLTCVRGPLRGQRWRAEGRTALILGREAGCIIRFPEGTPGVSRQHCRLEKTPGGWLLTDLNASYGTYVDGGRLRPGERRLLKPGETFCLGSSENAFQVQLA